MPSVTSQPLAPNVVVRAGAGAGKTTELVNRVIALAKKSHREFGRYPKLVITTFTRKATGELRERLLLAAAKEGDPRLSEYVQNESWLHISTIHGVLSLFLSRFGGVIGLSPQFQVYEEAQEQLEFRKILRQVLRSKKEEVGYFEKLLEESNLVTLESALAEYAVIYLTKGESRFPSVGELKAKANERWDEWKAQAEELLRHLKSETSPSWVTYCQLLESVVHSSDRKRELQNFLENKPSARLSKNSPEEIRELRNEVQAGAKTFLDYSYDPGAWQRHEELCQCFQSLAKEVTEKSIQSKIQSSEFSMNDLEVLSMYLIRQSPVAAQLFSEEWDYWLIDEYQDTSPLQVDLLKALVGQRNSFIVGDPQQSIYLFRGARCEVFSEKEEEVRRQGGEILSQMKNYRSRPELLRYFNQLFVNISSQFAPMEPHQVNLLSSEPPVIYWTDESDVEDFNEKATLARVQELLEKNVSPESICVLTRTNAELEKIAFRAKQLNIPYQVHASSQYFERREVLDAMSLLKFLVNPFDNKNLISLLRTPWFRLADDQMAHLTSQSGQFFWKAFEPVCPILANALVQTNTIGFAQVWLKTLIESGIFDFCNMQDPSGRREANLWKLVSLLFEKEKSPGFSYLQFCEDHTSSQQRSIGDALPVIEPRRVNLMTIHASKGLEFDYVIMPNMGQRPQSSRANFLSWSEDFSLFTLKTQDPQSQSLVNSLFGEEFLAKRQELDNREYERLLYVAMTRAKKGLTLIWKKCEKNSWAQFLTVPAEIRGHAPQLAESTNENKNFKEAPAKYRFPKNIKRQMISVTQTVQSSVSENLHSISRAAKGVEAHQFFESLKYRRGMNEVPEQFSEAYAFLKEWRHGVIFDVIKNGEVEWGFTLDLGGGQWLQGQIDLWGKDSQGTYWVIDYKTGSIDFADKAMEQLKQYSQALIKMNQIPSSSTLRLAAVFPFAQRVFEA